MACCIISPIVVSLNEAVRLESLFLGSSFAPQPFAQLYPETCGARISHRDTQHPATVDRPQHTSTSRQPRIDPIAPQ